MRHYIVASYPSADHAAGAVTGLMAEGFLREDIGVITSHSAPDSPDHRASPLLGTFSALGVSDIAANRLIERVDRGEVVVGLTTPDAVLAARAQGVMQRFEPTLPAEAYLGGTTATL